MTEDDDALDATLAKLRTRPAIARWLDDGARWVLTRTVLLRLLGAVYFVAFFSAFRQGCALVGEHGLLPMRGFLAALTRVSGGTTAAFVRAPSLFWIDASNTSWLVVTGLGAILSLAVVAGVTNAGVMLLLVVFQTSIMNVGQIFWGYGWEIQLVETGMLAVFLCPLRSFRPFAAFAPSVVVLWLFRWLLLRIMLGAGLIKLRGDPCWRELTCLMTHYETQPNPSPMSWVFHQLPPSVHVAGVLVNHLVELVVPLFMAGPRRVRTVAGFFLVGFQVLLIVSGNLSFLNWLTIVPAIACFDDAFFSKLVPARLRARLEDAPRPPSVLHRRAAIAYACLVGVLSVGPVLNLFSSRQAMNASFDPLHLVNTYGAFGSVGRTRDELVILGTRDETPSATSTWEEIELPCKPGKLTRRPCLVTPYHHRLDWQMWFAAMSTYDDEPWIVVLVDKLLNGDRAIAPLLAENPFQDAPPRWVRIDRYRYALTRWGSGPGWWRRTYVAPYMRPVARDDPELVSFLQRHALR